MYVELEAQDYRSRASSLMSLGFPHSSIQQPQKRGALIDWTDWNGPKDPDNTLNQSRGTRMLHILVPVALITAM
jgi:hypothetical protein